MVRERIRTTREDATGFEEGVTGVRKPTILKPFNQDALEAFNKGKQATGRAPEPQKTSSAPPQTQAEPKGRGANQGGTSQQTGVELQQAAQEAVVDDKVPSSDERHSLAAKGLVALVVPPRAQRDRGIKITLRLRILSRQVAAMNKLVEKGIDPEDVLRLAYSRLPKIRIEPRYVPRVQEPSGPTDWNYRTSVAVKKETLQAIEAQVLDGAKAPRSSLVLGQFERAWFASLDNTMRAMSK